MENQTQYFYQGREVTLLGQLGTSIYEIIDPSGRLNRGKPFTVAMTQVEQRQVYKGVEPETTSKSRRGISIDAKVTGT